MKRFGMKVVCEHTFKLDVPHFFSKEDDTPEEFYKIEILDAEDEVFIHLMCTNCYDEAHTMMSKQELQQVLDGVPIIQSKLKLL